MEGDLLNCCCCELLSKSPRDLMHSPFCLASSFVFVSGLNLCTVHVCGFDILVSSCNSAGLVNMLYQILLLWFKMCNMGVRPVAIVLTYQFMTLQQVTELFVLYLLAKVLALPSGQHQAF